jgi:hypothetical protein
VRFYAWWWHNSRNRQWSNTKLRETKKSFYLSQAKRHFKVEYLLCKARRSLKWKFITIIEMWFSSFNNNRFHWIKAETVNSTSGIIPSNVYTRIPIYAGHQNVWKCTYRCKSSAWGSCLSAPATPTHPTPHPSFLHVQLHGGPREGARLLSKQRPFHLSRACEMKRKSIKMHSHHSLRAILWRKHCQINIGKF